MDEAFIDSKNSTTPEKAHGVQLAAPSRPKNWLLVKVRNLHIWAGVAVAVFIVFMSLSGIYLNHKKAFERAFSGGMTWFADIFTLRVAAGAACPEENSVANPVATVCTTMGEEGAKGKTPEGFPVSFESALAIARAHFRGRPLKALELKDEKGCWVYKVRTADKAELFIDATTGSLIAKPAKPDPHGKDHSKDHGKKPDCDDKSKSDSVASSYPAALSQPLCKHENKHDDSCNDKVKGKGKDKHTPDNKKDKGGEKDKDKDDDKDDDKNKGLNIGKLIKDLHTGKFAGSLGRWFNDIVAMVMVLLTVSGVWLWWRSRSRMMAGAAARAGQRAGMTLLELLVVLFILTLLTTLAVSSLDSMQEQTRYERNQALLDHIREAVGPSDIRQPDGTTMLAGFVSDIGRAPRRIGDDPRTQLRELWSGEGLPAFSAVAAPAPDSDVVLGIGWRGPYLRLPTGATGLTDGWGWPFALTFDPTTNQLIAIRSRGSDNADGGVTTYAVDVELIFPAHQLFGTLTGRVKQAKRAGVKVDGNKTETTTPCVVKLFLPNPDAGTVRVQSVEAVHPDFHFRFDNVPVGIRVLRASQTITKTEPGKPTKTEVRRETKSLLVPRGGLYEIELNMEKINDD